MVVGELLAVEKLSVVLELLSPGLRRDTVEQRSATGQRQKKPGLHRLPKLNRLGVRVKQTVIVDKENIPEQRMSAAARLQGSKQKNQQATPEHQNSPSSSAGIE